MQFKFDYCYPNKENPEFVVYQIDESYQFIVYDASGNEESKFIISISVLKNKHQATGHIGNEGKAIENFRKQFLK